MSSRCQHGDEHGGVSTNWDPYGTRRRLGLPEQPWEHICWPCYDEWGVAKDKAMRAETDALACADGRCGFLEAWIGHCAEMRPCAKHESQRCWKCGASATRNCAHAGTLVCGMPECLEHPHPHALVRVSEPSALSEKEK